MNPPDKLDGAMVLEWAWSDTPFGEIRDTNGKMICRVHGLAICQYTNNQKVVYRFVCDQLWKVQQDADYETVEDAKRFLPQQYMNADIVWHVKFKV